MTIEISPIKCTEKLSWHEAIRYCQKLDIDRKADWRLPAKHELHQMIMSDIFKKELEEDKHYWTSTELNPQLAWIQVNDYQYNNFKTEKYHVIAVRTA
jgi:hypothetical protein